MGRRAALAALAVLVALGGAYAWRSAVWLRRAPAPPLEPDSLVVVPFTSEDPEPGSVWLRQGLAEMIRSQLGQTPGIHMVARHSLNAALREAGYDPDRGLTRETAVRIARQLRAEKLVTGSFFQTGDRFTVDAEVVDVSSGRNDGAASVRGERSEDLLDAVDALCLQLLGGLIPPKEPDGSHAWRPARLPTRSVEAYRKYVEALASFARGGRRGAEEAEERLDEAVRLDPSFAQAYIKKAEVQHWRRRWAYGEADPAPAVRAAVQLVKDLPDRERLLVESFEALLVRSDLDAALKAWSTLLQFYPTYAQEVGIPGLVADAFQRLGRWDDLITVAEAHVESPSLPEAEQARLSALLSQAYRQKGGLERALHHARRAVELWPAREGPEFLRRRATLGRVLLEAGRRAEALGEFRAVSAAPEADALNVTTAAWGFYMAGDAAEAEALVERALALDAAYGNAHHLRGWLLFARQDYSRAAASLEQAFERTPPAFGNPYLGQVGGDLAALYYAGVAYQRLGRKERAAEAFERLTTHCRGILQHQAPGDATAPGWQAANFLARAAARRGQSAREPPRLQGDDATYFVQTARLHAVQGRRDEALRELAQGLALGFGGYRHIQDDPDFEPLRGEAEFKRLVTDRLPR